jgi:uncharacterized protein YaeQ
MAIGATMYRIQVALSDVDRGVYESLDLRLARHPSESPRYLMTRALAYCLSYEEGIAFAKGVSDGDEPALWVHSLDGRLLTWIEVGTPSADRLHRASKAANKVLVYTQHDPAMVHKEATTRAIHKAEDIEVIALAPPFLDELMKLTERNASWDVTRSEGQLYVTCEGKSLEAALEITRLGEQS